MDCQQITGNRHEVVFLFRKKAFHTLLKAEAVCWLQSLWCNLLENLKQYICNFLQFSRGTIRKLLSRDLVSNCFLTLQLVSIGKQLESSQSSMLTGKFGLICIFGLESFQKFPFYLNDIHNNTDWKR